MNKLIICGNSGSGKSTLALRYARALHIDHLDLDTIAWKPNDPGIRNDIETSCRLLAEFTRNRAQWVIEGCYGSLIERLLETATEFVFLNPSIESCQNNCRARPWEPHKYDSMEAQNENLNMLLDWVSTYETRDDEFSYSKHKTLYDSFKGKKTIIRSNREAEQIAKDLRL